MYSILCPSPLGQIKITASDTGLLSVLFVDEETDEVKQQSTITNAITNKTVSQLDEYFSGTRQAFDLPLSPVGTPFQQKVWHALNDVSFGTTKTYSSIAKQIDNPLSVRAVGAANGKNPICIIIPCHRIIGANGTLTGYAGGLWRKEELLKLEGRSSNIQTKLWH